MFSKAIPLVSVLTASCNGVRTLPATIESILSQTCADFEYLIVDDASTDQTLDLLQHYAAKDARIRILSNPRNLNAAGTLNRALSQARGEYIAILDHDDLSYPQRLAQQVTFLNQNPDIGAIGSQVRFIDQDNQTISNIAQYPILPVYVKWLFLFICPFLHSTLMFRRQIGQSVGGYSVKHPYICDYEFVARLLQVTRMANLPDELGCNRIWPESLSYRHRQHQQGQILLFQFALQRRWLGLQPDLAVMNTIDAWRKKNPPHDEAEANRAVQWMEQMWRAFLARNRLSPKEMDALNQSESTAWLSYASSAWEKVPAAAQACWRNAAALDPQFLDYPEPRTHCATFSRKSVPASSPPLANSGTISIVPTNLNRPWPRT